MKVTHTQTRPRLFETRQHGVSFTRRISFFFPFFPSLSSAGVCGALFFGSKSEARRRRVAATEDEETATRQFAILSERGTGSHWAATSHTATGRGMRV